MLFIGSHLFTPQKAKAAVACSEGAAAQNGIKVIPSHASVFYIDSGVNPKLDAGYIGYRVVNQTGSAQQSLWTQVSSFYGTVTEDAVKQFQTANNLPALGTVGPMTRRVLNTYR